MHESFIMKTFFLCFLLCILFWSSLLFRAFVLYFFLRNFYILDCQHLIDFFVVPNTCVCLFIEPLIMLTDCLVLLSFVGIKNILRQMAIVCNSSYLVAMNIFANQFFSIFNCPFLACAHCACWSPSNALPKTDVHIFRT